MTLCSSNILHQDSHRSLATRSRAKLKPNLNPKPSSKQPLPSLLQFVVLLTALLDCASCIVVYQVRFIVAKNGRTDYALAGESMELSCHYIMKDEAEDVKQLVWSKDGKNFLRWSKNKPGLEVLSYTFKGHIEPTSTHSRLLIRNTTIDMHGKYKCSVRTDLGTHEMEADLIVISRTNCKLSDWRVISEPQHCRELYWLDCKNMFPRPVTSCGLWNSKLDKFIRSVTVDISEELNKQTYRIRYSDKFELGPNGSTGKRWPQADLLQYAGHLTFKCDISVPDTSWKLSLVHRMFNYDDGCYQSPLDTIERMRQNYSQYATARMQGAGFLLDKQTEEFEMLASRLKYELLPPLGSKSPKVKLNCWRKPNYGSLARLSCATDDPQVRLTGTSLLECREMGWIPVSENDLLLSGRLAKRRTSRGEPTTKSPLSDSHEEETSTEIIISTGGSQNFEESSTQPQPPPPPPQPTTTTTASLQTATELEYIPTTQDIYSSSDSFANQLLPELSPAQLAFLLPTCVSSKRATPTTIATNRLPLRDEGRFLESSSTSLSSSSSTKQSDNREDSHRGSVFNFSSSSATPSPAFQYCINQLLWFLLLASLGLSILLANQKPLVRYCKL